MNKEFWTNKNVLVTGADGFLATHLISKLIGAGAAITGIIRTKKAFSVLADYGLFDKINVVYGNVIDARLIIDTIDKFNIDTIYHLAASSQVSAAAASPVNTFQTNILGTINVLEAARIKPCVQRTIVSSSDKAYGDHRTILPYREDYAVRGIYPYDASKSCTDLIAQTYFTAYRVPLRITRCTNIYGAGDMNFLRLVPGTIIRTLLGKNTEILSHIAPVIREFVFIDDVVEAYFSLTESINPDGKGDSKIESTPQEGYRAYSHCAYNIGGGYNSRKTVEQIVKMILHKMGQPELCKIVEGDSKCQELPSQYADSSKLSLELGWQPKVCIEDGISRAIEWYSRNLDKFKVQANSHFKD